ncbi:MAG TPA: tetratricopeptide repeat protein, partial [Candidatus Kapabacteria bacterium]|nr:tetratricopeptide repeat protein [Candidatus Kapabacteria bacterium]
SLKDVLEDDPSNIELREAIAQSYVQLNQTDSAIGVYTDLLERFPGSPSVEIALATVYSSNSQWSKAFGYYTAALNTDSLGKDTVDFILDSLYSHIHADSGSIKTIQPVIETYARKDSADWYAHILLGGVQLYNKQNAEAYATIHHAILHAPDTTAALLFGMQMFIEHERYEDMFRLSREVNVASDFRIPFLRAFAYERMKKYPEAINELNASLQLNAHFWQALSELGMDYDEMHNTEKSDSAYIAALALNPNDPVVLNNYSYGLAERGIMLDSAKEMSARALAADSGNANYMDTYGWIFYKLGEYDSAAFYLQRAVQDTSVSAAVIEHLGDVRYKLGQYKEALRLWHEALAKDESNESLKQKILENAQHDQ